MSRKYPAGGRRYWWVFRLGLIVMRQAIPELSQIVDRLIAPMDFGSFYDGRAKTHCNTNPAIPGNQPTGQMYGGYYVGLPPRSGDNWTPYYYNGALQRPAHLGLHWHGAAPDARERVVA